jgi:anti-sigma factor RsiW
MTQPLTCQELVELITDYLEDALSPADRARFETHISACTACTNYLSQMRRTIQLTGQLTPDSIPLPEQTELLALFHNWKNGTLN